MKDRIIKDIESSDHYSECDYESWKHFLSDANIENKEEYDKVLYEDFTELELDQIWQQTHNKQNKKICG